MLPKRVHLPRGEVMYEINTVVLYLKPSLAIAVKQEVGLPRQNPASPPQQPQQQRRVLLPPNTSAGQPRTQSAAQTGPPASRWVAPSASSYREAGRNLAGHNGLIAGSQQSAVKVGAGGATNGGSRQRGDYIRLSITAQQQLQEHGLRELLGPDRSGVKSARLASGEPPPDSSLWQSSMPEPRVLKAPSQSQPPTRTLPAGRQQPPPPPPKALQPQAHEGNLQTVGFLPSAGSEPQALRAGVMVQLPSSEIPRIQYPQLLPAVSSAAPPSIYSTGTFSTAAYQTGINATGYSQSQV